MLKEEVFRVYFRVLLVSAEPERSEGEGAGRGGKGGDT